MIRAKVNNMAVLPLLRRKIMVLLSNWLIETHLHIDLIHLLEKIGALA